METSANTNTNTASNVTGTASSTADTNASANAQNNGTNVQTQNNGENASKSGDEKTFTQSEMNAAIEARIARERKSFEKQLSEKLAERDKIAKMDAEEKAKYEREQAEKSLADREAAITRRELEAVAKVSLSEKGLPLELAVALDYSSEENCNKSIESINKAFTKALEKALNDKLRAEPPKAGTANKAAGIVYGAKTLI